MGDVVIRHATAADAPNVARLIQDFETEFDNPSPAADVLVARVRELLTTGEMTVLLAGEGPDGFAQLRFRRSVLLGGWTALLEELYVVPGLRGRGIGRALVEAAVDAAQRAGATSIEVGTSEDDTAAMALYESAGFSNREDSPDGPVMYCYIREL